MDKSLPTFGKLLSKYRNDINLSQRQLAQKIDVSASYIAILEAKRSVKYARLPSRDIVLRMIHTLELWPPESDALLRSAMHETDRSACEELDIQRKLTFTELIIFARLILEAPDDGDWYEVVKQNLTIRNIRYSYFTSDGTAFGQLKQRLISEGVGQGVIESQLACFILPEDLFVSNFALYLRNNGVYACGTKQDSTGHAKLFFTIEANEAKRLNDQVMRWRQNIYDGTPIVLARARRIHPSLKETRFVSV